MSDTRPYSARLLDAIAAVGHQCTHRELRVLLAFATFADKNGEPYPSHVELAAKTRLPVRHVRDALDSLSVSWLASANDDRRPALLLTIRHGSGSGRSTVRRLLIDDNKRCTESVQVPTPEHVHQNSAPSKTERCTDLDTKGAPIQAKRCTESVRLTGLTGKEQEDSAADKPPVKAFTDYFASAWQRHRGAKYPHGGAKDANAAKRVLSHTGNDLPEARRLVDAYLAKPDAWLDGNGKPLSLMPRTLPALVARPPIAPDGFDLSDRPSPGLRRHHPQGNL